MTTISPSVSVLRGAALAIVFAAGCTSIPTALAHEAVLKAGASKVDITPSGDKLPGIFTGILDPIHVRAIALESGAQRAALVTVDAGAIPNEIWQRLTTRAEAELGIPANHVILTATHTHSVPFGWSVGYEAQLYQAVEEAVAALQPAKMAFGTGVSYINVNRNIIDPQTGRWWEGPNYQGPSDKTVAVLSFQSLNGAHRGVLQLRGTSGDHGQP